MRNLLATSILSLTLALSGLSASEAQAQDKNQRGNFRRDCTITKIDQRIITITRPIPRVVDGQTVYDNVEDTLIVPQGKDGDTMLKELERAKDH